MAAGLKRAELLTCREPSLVCDQSRPTATSAHRQKCRCGTDHVQSAALPMACPKLRQGTRRPWPVNPPAHLPRPIGRVRDLSAASAVPPGSDTGLVTVTAVGGVGKTRLALGVVERVKDEFQDRAWLVELAPVREDALHCHAYDLTALVDFALFAPDAVAHRAGRRSGALSAFLTHTSRVASHTSSLPTRRSSSTASAARPATRAERPCRRSRRTPVPSCAWSQGVVDEHYHAPGAHY